MMGDIFATSEHKDVASLYYARIVKNYPLSSLAPGAKDKLKASGVPVPQADPNALAWMTAEQNTPRPHTPMYKKPLDLMKSGPNGEFLSAARTGAPNMQPESDSSAGDLLTPGKSAAGAGTGIVATVVPGTTGSTSTAETVGSENAAPATNDGTATAPATGEAPKEAGTELTPAPGAPATAAPTTATPTAASDEAAKNPPAAAGAAETPAKSDAATTGTESKSDATDASTTPATDAAKTGDSQSSDDSKKESTSKKKKGLRKLVPW